MLKIKDSVDLKELEKYGFKYNEYGDLCKELKIKEQFDEVTVLSICVDLTDKKYLRRIGLITNGVYCFDYELDILYDLIKAGLVEKVDD